jgi:hypothetical protein
MAHVVHTYNGKMAMAGIDFPPDVDPVWEQLRASNAHPDELKRDEVTLLGDVLTSILYYGRAHVVVDTPMAAESLRSKAELRASGLTPYFTPLCPLDIINWGKGWLITKQFISTTEPFAETTTYVVYKYYGEGVTCEYRVPCQITTGTDNEGNLYPVVAKVQHKGEWLKPDDEMLWQPTQPIYGAGIDRVVSTVVTEDKWLCLALYNKQIQHLRIENAWTDAGYLSGTVQRVFTPADPAPTDDPRISYNTDNLQKELEKAGNAHILIGKGYSFVESSGAALGNLEGMIDKIEAQIAKIANLSFISGSKTALEQSGLSKRLDMSLLDGTLKDYGNILVDTYNTLLAKVAELMAIRPIEIGGLSDFTDKDPTQIVGIIQILATIPDFPPLARMAVYRMLLDNLNLTLSPEDQDALDEQMANPDSINTEIQPDKDDPRRD